MAEITNVVSWRHDQTKYLVHIRKTKVCSEVVSKQTHISLCSPRSLYRGITQRHHTAQQATLRMSLTKKKTNKLKERVPFGYSRKLEPPKNIFWIFIMYYFLFHSQGNPSFRKGVLWRHSIDEGGSPPKGHDATPAHLVLLWRIYQVACVIYVCINICMYVWIILVCRFNKVIVWLQRFSLGLFCVNFKGMKDVRHRIISVLLLLGIF